MKNIIIGIIALIALVTIINVGNQRYAPSENMTDIKITPISHATLVLSWDNASIYIDPTGGAEAFADQAEPNLILITDIHGDHLSTETLQAVSRENTTLIMPQSVADELPENLPGKIIIIGNDETTNQNGFSIKAIPMYNLREEALQFHTKGRGNGYVLENNGKRVYIAGDTEDIPEMRALKNIDIAFLPMNLPYTMPVEAAADAVLEFQPKTVYPYHYRGTDGLSDVEKFKSIVNESNPEIEVVLLDWYPEN